MSSPTPPPRDAVSRIPAYQPGKPAADEAYKLASNEHPLGPLPSVQERIADAATRVNRYPDTGSSQLFHELSQRLGVSAGQLVAGTGSVSVLYHLLAAWCEPGDDIVYPWRSFEAYPIATALSGAQGIAVPNTDDGHHDLPAMLEALTPRTKAMLICTPNNPTGPVIDHQSLSAFLDDVPDHVLVVIDEAYVEFVSDPHAANGRALLADHPNVVVLRTFSKAYGLAGLRVGYAIAHRDIATAIAKAIPPFSVSTIAQEAALASLDASEELAHRVSGIIDERERVVTALRTQGWHVPDTQANFCWVPLGDPSAAVAEQLAPLAVRVFAGEGIRVSIGAADVNDVFIAKMAAIAARP